MKLLKTYILRSLLVLSLNVTIALSSMEIEPENTPSPHQTKIVNPFDKPIDQEEKEKDKLLDAFKAIIEKAETQRETITLGKQELEIFKKLHGAFNEDNPDEYFCEQLIKIFTKFFNLIENHKLCFNEETKEEFNQFFPDDFNNFEFSDPAPATEETDEEFNQFFPENFDIFGFSDPAPAAEETDEQGAESHGVKRNYDAIEREIDALAEDIGGLDTQDRHSLKTQKTEE